MHPHVLTFCLTAVLLVPRVVSAFAEEAARRPDVSEDTIDFGRDVLPILSRSCFRCHEGREAASGVRLDQRSVLLGTDDEEPLVIPGEALKSRLWQAVSQQDAGLRMPPEGPRLTTAELNRLRRWIDEGMAWNDHLLPEDSDAAHWAFQPIERPEVPGDAELQDANWPENEIDRFIGQRHREHGISPSRRADRRTLIRRLSLSLLGLPPSPEEVRQFRQDERPDAWSRLVDRTLASPLYGERWARHWLDVARWAESEGYESNHPRPSAWRYRDYVVRSFNDDRPFDEFIRQQIAGDEIAEYSDDNLIATGFLAAARISSNEEDKWLQRNDVNVDIVNAVGNAFLGVTIQCAQCHDHKFDPLTSRDFYSLQAFFVRGQPTPVRLPSAAEISDGNTENAKRFRSLLQRKRELFDGARRDFVAGRLDGFSDEQRQAVAIPLAERSPEQELMARRVEVQIQISNRRVIASISGDAREEYDRISKELNELESTFQRAFAFYSPVGSPHQLDVLDAAGFYPLPFDRELFEHTRAYVMPRGDVHRIGETVFPDWPTLLDPRRSEAASDDQLESIEEGRAGSFSHGRSRLNLADWLTHRSNPLVARVWVNRIWSWHFGRGLVETVDDFGVRGTRPTHPELLDWLASELIDNGWSTKHIQRLILTSAAWQQASGAGQETIKSDPDNVWLTRWSPRRLEAEVVRDSLLAWSGELDLAVGGPSVDVDDREDSLRRSLYLFQKRGRPAEMQGLFDGPNECSATVGQRQVSTSPLQSLYLLNHDFSLQRARTLAAEQSLAGRSVSPRLTSRVSERLAYVTAAQSDVEVELVTAAWQRILQRDPNSEELRLASDLLRSMATTSESPNAESGEAGQGSRDSSGEQLSPLGFLCQSLMNLNEAAYLE